MNYLLSEFIIGMGHAWQVKQHKYYQSINLYQNTQHEITAIGSVKKRFEIFQQDYQPTW